MCSSDLRVGAEGDRNVGIVRNDGAPNERVGAILSRVAHAEPALQLATHALEQFILQLRRRRLILERQDGHRMDMRRKRAFGEAITHSTGAEEKQDGESMEDPR